MDVKNENNAFDQAGFEAFFKTHPNDATVAEEIPTTETTDPVDTDTTAVDADAAESTAEATGDASGTTADDGAGTNNGDPNASSEKANTSTTANTKQAQAFAQMRIANQQQQQLIKQIAQVVGVADTKDTGAVMKALQDLAIKAQAQKQGIPEEILARLNQLEGMNQEYQKQQAYLAAGRGFQNIKDKFKLDDTALENFAQELISDGLNPYEQPIDLLREYQTRHFDELINQAVQKGIEQEAKRAAKAGAQSTTPPDTSGGATNSEPTKINSVSELNKWLEENK